MNDHQLKELVYACLSDFYERRLNTLNSLKLKTTLKRKNPYLFRAIGVEKASELVERLLQAHMSSSEETTFGDSFFEPLVKAVCRGSSAAGIGLDVLIETEQEYTVISVKSGPNWGNSSQMAKIQQDFNTAHAIFQNRRIRKQYRALLGHCYGRKTGEPTAKRMYAIRSGQAFWQELTGDENFYIRIIQAMNDYPEKHAVEYSQAWDRAVNRFTLEFLKDFASADGAIAWERLTSFNSGSSRLTK